MILSDEEREKEGIWRQGQDMVNQLWFDWKCFEIPIVYVLSKVFELWQGRAFGFAVLPLKFLSQWSDDAKTCSFAFIIESYCIGQNILVSPTVFNTTLVIERLQENFVFRRYYFRWTILLETINNKKLNTLKSIDLNAIDAKILWLIIGYCCWYQFQVVCASLISSDVIDEKKA